MDILISSIRQAIFNKNWFAALFLSLTLPDICGSLEFPSLYTGERYKKWCDKYYMIKYGSHLFSAKDCYALRNACLHSCSDSDEKMTFSRIHFVEPQEGYTVHRNLLDNVLQLQIDCFCNELCNAVEEWLKEINTNPEIKAKIDKLMKVYKMFSLEPYIRIS